MLSEATISSCLIVKNEVKNLPLLIDDLRRFSDEIIIVDTGSDDGTLEWLKEHQDNVLKLYEYEWIDDFAAARNFSFSKASKRWIFWCDADDRISEKLIDKLCELKKLLYSDFYKNYNAFAMFYHYTNQFTQYRIRLIKKQANPRWECIVHESLTCDNMNFYILQSEYAILHQSNGGKPHRNIKIFEKHINNGYKLSNRETFCYAHELVVLNNDITDPVEANKNYEKAQNLVYNLLLDPESPEILVWEAMADIMANLWMSSIPQANIGIAIINRLEEIRRVRADIYYLRAVLYDLVGEKEKSVKDCYNAINTVFTDLDTYNEKVVLSKVYPAMALFNTAKDDFTRNRMLDIIRLYKDSVQEVEEFLRSVENPDVVISE